MNDIQAAKEEARLLALKLGLALERHGNSIESISIEGERKLVVQNATPDTIWQIARDKLKANAGGSLVDERETYPRCENIIAHADGGSRGNPGPSAAGFTLNDALTNSLLEEGGEYLGITTNNQAEYHALKMVLENSLKYQPSNLKVHMDSLLVVNQLNGIYKVKSRDLWPVHQDIKSLALKIPSVSFIYVPREQNKAADAMVNKILDKHAHTQI